MKTDALQNSEKIQLSIMTQRKLQYLIKKIEIRYYGHTKNTKYIMLR